MGSLWFVLILVIVGASLAFWGVTRRNREQQASSEVHNKKIADIPRKVARNKDVHLPILVETLRQAFPDNADVITEFSMSSFYDKIGLWISSHEGGTGSSAQMDFVSGKERYSNGESYRDVVARALDVAPEPIRTAANANFDGWWRTMDQTIRFSVQKAIAKGYEVT